MVDVFFSYSREERAKITPMLEALKAEGLDVWSDSKMNLTANIIREINNKLAEAKCILVAWSRLSIQSDWVLDEAYEGFERRCLAAIKIDDVRIPVPFARIETLDLRNWSSNLRDPDWRRLVESIRGICQSEPAPAPPDAKEQKELDDKPIGLEPELAVSPPKSKSAAKEPASAPVSEADRAKALVVETLTAANGPVPMATVAHLVHVAFAKSITKDGWFGHSKFSDFFKSLAIDGYSVTTQPHGTIFPNAGDPAKAASKSAAPAVPPQAGARAVEDLQTRLFNMTEAPRLEPKDYKAVFKEIAKAIRAGGSSIGAITASARDGLVKANKSIGRQKISFILKGSLIAGLSLTERMVAADQVGYHFASALYRQCAARGWELSANECEEVLKLLGLEEVEQGA